MRVFFRRRGRNQRSWSVGGSTCYRSASYRPLRPWQVRERRFRPSRFGRRGLDPDEVAEFLDRVADDLAAVYDALARSRQESDRIRDALRRWQSEQFRARLAGRQRAERGGVR
ncbi:DivIVA domain-containing protein [Micromonospora narathiwatensis]|uniref:DivIVA domain-containing protein n=1 Tax=Micromonospora narathiwatensis TaxID=299146 RepID=A0A1A8ZZB2_9ACTN|nr:DivIVA domain-containing protein [Micromonospora narathiwatensis]SBT49226.1 DivIVA domain-containing protein [Micromonospora narathiwatensis]